MKRISAATANPMSAGAQYSAGLWLMPPRQRTNIIDDGAEPRHHLGVVPGARRQADRAAAEIADGGGERILQRIVARHRRDIVERLERHVEFARGRDPRAPRCWMVVSAVWRALSLMHRRSMVNETAPGMMLVAPG